MNWIIDRIEGDFAVCEAEDIMLDIPLVALPDGVREGDVVLLTIDKKQIKNREDNINRLMNDLFTD